MYNRFTARARTKSFISNFSLLMSVVIVLSFAYGFLPINMTVGRGIIDILQFVAMAATMAYVLKTILEDF